ncbi:RNase A-like domain-containing protein [Nocardioides sp. Leaf374]|uniref:RNase A-like domain-containing protein n=1 Tax=Nocardioides sp. Leaf374 TaxID=2876560 RepID=UPI001E3BC07A|nr:RNase A-like domain-containing protein [Nocardioides sp. Leaf374]
MRIDVDGAGFLTAEHALATGNRRCAEHLDDLTDALAGLGGMAGDDATSADFAAAYDTAAAEVVAGLGDCVTALACLGRLTATSRAEHERAEAGAVLRGVVVPGAVVAPDGEVSPAGGPGDLGWVAAMPSPPPTALGGDWSAVPTGLGWVIDLIQGFAWPSADVGELRTAGATWVDCARAVADLTSDCGAAVRGLEGEVSPEIPLAVDACQEVSDQLAAIAEEAYGLGRACEQYADQVESHRAEVVALVVQLLAETVVIQGAGMLLNSVTGGGGTVGATALTGTRVAAITPDVLAVAARLRAANEVLAASVRNAAVRVTIARGRLEKFRYARSGGLSDEAGQIRVVAPRPWDPGPGWLRTHEVRGSHTIERHVGRSTDWLQGRLDREPTRSMVGSFDDLPTAEAILHRVLSKHSASIDDWLRGSDATWTYRGVMDDVSGTVLHRGGLLERVRGLRIVLRRDPEMPQGFRILTAFPEP